ncbi:hypothetical protein Hanom_Chr07g00629541 [Helianthus anomalus]
MLKIPPTEPQSKPPSPPPQQPSPNSLHIHQSPPQHHTLSPIHEQPQITSPHIQQTPPTIQPPVDTTHRSFGFTKFPPIPEDITLERLDDFSFVNDDLLKKLQKKVVEVFAEKKKLEKRLKTVEAENSSLLKKVEADQVDIDILKVRIAYLEEEKARRDEQNEYFKLKNKELEAKNPIEQRFEEIELEELGRRRKAEMKNNGKSAQVEGVIEVTEREIVPSKVTESPCPITSVPGDEDDEEDEDNNLKDDADEVYFVHSDNDDDGNDDDDDDQGTSSIKVTEASNEEKIDEYLQDNANEEPENASGEGEHDNAEKMMRMLIRVQAEIVKMMVIEDSEFNFDFEEELNKFDINHQPKYEYKYVKDVDNYDKVEVEDCSDGDPSENVNVDTSSFPTLAELFSQAKEDELRRKVAESIKNKSFTEMSKEEKRGERKKWFRKDTE